MEGFHSFSMLVMWCCCPLLMAGGKDMSLPVFIPLNVVVLFISVYTPYLSLLARLWSHGFKAVEASLRLETFSFGLSLLGLTV